MKESEWFYNGDVDVYNDVYFLMCFCASSYILRCNPVFLLSLSLSFEPLKFYVG